MNIFAVTTCNLDIPSEGNIIQQYFTKEVDAYKACIKWVKDFKGLNTYEDVFGKFTHSEGCIGKSLSYCACKGKSALYYTSHFGNFNCVVYINTITVH